MYTQFFSFSERPFDISPDPRFLYLTPGHRETLASMIYGVTERKGFISVTGEVGTGKTLLIYALLRNLNQKARVIHISHTDITFEQLVKTIFLNLDLPITGSDSFLMLHELNEHLLRRLAWGGNVALIIDEAQNLSREVMEQIRMLSNLETAKEKLLQILLVGQPELEVKLNSNDLRQFKQRIGIRRRIKPLSRDEATEYMDHRLHLVGSRVADVFTKEALELIYLYSQGIPRTINIVCDNAFLIGFSTDEKLITSKIVREVLSDLDGGPSWVEQGQQGEAKKGTSGSPEEQKVEVLRACLRRIRSMRESNG
jgi:general secretion pathway protein A